MMEAQIKELTRKIEMESKKLDRKIRDIEKIKSSITKDLKKNVKELKAKQLKKLQEEKKNITDKVKQMKTNLINAKKDDTTNKVSKRIEDSKKLKENQTVKKPADKTAKKMMNLMALYNKNANEELIEVLLTVKEDDLKKETGAYFKSIYGIFKHMIQCDMYFFGIFRKYSNKKNIANEEVLTYLNNDFSFNRDIDKDLKTLIEVRKKLDDVIIAIVNSIDNFNISGKVVVPNKEVKKPRYHLIMHELNHSTHHRGEISVLLDQMGYKNDYSNLMTMV
ncbi:DinB family protein [Brachyspira innocens]|uniref:DinB family protein n=1 Tax=Brachyspira innocens TaxID=13264 RepID=A0ABT8Z1H2_9SPIR|nr:DinB family protein [Brachyspira innocens]MDO7021289.1 DinB family protein [Brachyspira innocens]